MPAHHPCDRTLAARAARGDVAAFETLAGRHRADLVRFARGRLSGGLEHLAEDAVQEAMLKAFRALGKGTVPPEPRAWLHVIVRNCCADARRGAPASAELPEQLAAVTGDVAEQVSSSDRLGRVVGAIGALPASQRAMLVGREFEGHSYEQLASSHATTVGAVKSLLVRARRNLAAAPGVLAWSAPVLWAQRRMPLLVAGRDAGGDLAAGVHGGTALAAVAAAAVMAVPAPPPAPLPDRGPAPAARVAEVRAASADRSAPEPPTPGRVLEVCASGQTIDPAIPRSVLRRALRELPADLSEYTSCRQDLRRAELATSGVG